MAQKMNEKHIIKIGGMQCSFCVQSITKAYTRMDGVSDVSVNLSHEEALVEYNPDKTSVTKLNDTMVSLGYTVRDSNKVRTFEEEQEELKHAKIELFKAAAVTSVAFIFMVLNWTGNGQPWFEWIMLSLTLGMIFVVGKPILKMATGSLRRGILNQHVLMEFGAFGGLIGGLIGFYVQPWPMADFMGAAIFITAYHILSGYVSLHVRTKSSRAIMNLMELQPPEARVVRDGKEKQIPIEEVKIGDRVRVRPGENIPVDGKIIDGNSSVDQSLVTGESIPAIKNVGDEVIGGSINQFGTLVIQVTKIGDESFLQQVAKSIQEARALKPGILAAVDRVLKYFVPAVLWAAAIAFLIWTFGAWLVVGEPNFSRAIFATLAVLVLGYPCALGMATPLAMIRGGGLAAQKGILMRSGEAFQVFKDVSIIALDKTGTITEGKPSVVDIIPTNGTDKSTLMTIAAAAERSSEHPLALAIVKYAELQNYDFDDVVLEDFQAISGSGIRVLVKQAEIVLGSPRFLKDEMVDLLSMSDQIAEMESKGWTVIGVAENKKLLGLISISDTIKADAKYAISEMKAIGLEPILITGDSKRVANYIASQVGISKIVAEVLPQEKAEKIRELQKNKTRVAMVGDGINDAPALMQADVGIAFNSGTDIAIESADVVLVNNNLMGVVNAYHIGKSSFSKTKQNVLLAFTFNGVGVPLAMTGLVHPVFAMIAMAASVTAVLLNSYGGRLIPSKTEEVSSQSFEEALSTELKTHQISYRIPTIHCQGCISGLKETLEELPGIVSVDGDADSKTLIMDFVNEEANFKKVKKVIQNAGHKIEQEVTL
ncbi:MAG: Copper-exporting P-type ATPase A [Candidatus Heimdallarchaeota archaeon LC_2]|nr:MAG: Copper-exporting P-type ATPase A [Candidatus Heimdallarchaeota archaeon LC_2]